MRQQTTRISPEDISRQLQYCREVAALSAARPAQPLAFVDTYGCQQNEADSEQIRGMLREMGYAFTEDTSVADVIVINTCAIREHAELRVLGNVGALTHTKRRKPNQVICLCGCSMQEPHMAEKIRKSFRHVDLVFGPHALWRFPELLQQVLLKKERVFATEQSDGRIAEVLPVVKETPVLAGVCGTDPFRVMDIYLQQLKDQGFNGVQSQMCNMAAQAQDCCCQTQRAIDGVNYNMATNTCAIQNTIQGSTRDILENNNSNTRAILDFLTQSKIDSLQAENQSLKLAASQANQNSYLTATLDAQTSELIRRINPMPVPAYQVPAPYPYCGAYNNGCGCGC